MFLPPCHSVQAQINGLMTYLSTNLQEIFTKAKKPFPSRGNYNAFFNKCRMVRLEITRYGLLVKPDDFSWWWFGTLGIKGKMPPSRQGWSLPNVVCILKKNRVPVLVQTAHNLILKPPLISLCEVRDQRLTPTWISKIRSHVYFFVLFLWFFGAFADMVCNEKCMVIRAYRQKFL